MAETRYQSQMQTRVGTRAEIDAGLRTYMLGVYNYMALGVAFTAIVTLFHGRKSCPDDDSCSRPDEVGPVHCRHRPRGSLRRA